jgi:hypothetical protein
MSRRDTPTFGKADHRESILEGRQLAFANARTLDRPGMRIGHLVGDSRLFQGTDDARERLQRLLHVQGGALERLCPGGLLHKVICKSAVSGK